MEETAVKKKSPKYLIVLLVTALVIVGGSASAFFLMAKSPKVQYFLAEAETYKQMGTLFEERYKNELDWMKVQQAQPVETIYDLSAEWNDPSVDYEMQEFQSILNSVVLSMKHVNDPVKKEMELDFGGEFGSVSSKLVTMFATPEKALFQFPFKDELIQFNDADYGKLMKELDEDYVGNEELGLSYLFENDYVFTEEIRTYLGKEYMEHFIKEIPEEAFSSDKEEISVFGEQRKTTKVVMNLSEEQVKTLFKNLFEKAKNDEKLKEIVREQILFTTFGEGISNDEVKEMMETFDEGLEVAIEDVDTWIFPDGLQSTIWHDSNNIVKREFTVSIGEDKEDIGTLTVAGTQLLEKTQQQWDYSVNVKDSFGDEGVMKIKGDLTWKDQQAEDSFMISMDEFKVVYKGQEQLKDNKRTFTRSFGFTDGDIDPAIVWKGTATHEKDSMKADHTLTISDDVFVESPFNLIVKQQGKVVKNVEMPVESDDTVNLGEMDMDQLDRFIYYDFIPKVEGWFYGLLGELEGEL